MKVLSSIPFLRILIPFIGGILAGIFFLVPPVSWVYLVVLLSFITLFHFSSRFKNKWFFLIAADVFLFAYGFNLVGFNNTALQESFYGNTIQPDSTIRVVVVIDDIPVKKEKFTKCSIKILESENGEGYQKVVGNSLGYFKRSIKDSLLQPGNVLLLKTRFLEVRPPQNPYAFDYKNYLYHKQVYHTVFVNPDSFEVLDGAEYGLNFFWRLGLSCKQFVLGRLKNSALDENAYSVCCALLTGYDDEIDKTVMEAFSHSGTLHVLSVSGLHTGLIYLVLSFLFDLADRKRIYKLGRFISITLILWMFALITGFSAPVLRAVLMFTLLGVGKIYFRNSPSNQINILLVSAFILLVFNPFYITDVGFLLSYFALAGLICFQPGLSALWKPRYRLANAVWQSTTASCAATISTLPFTLFYFKQFPIWFFICNVVVIPATFVILWLALLVVLKLGPAAVIINYLMHMLTSFINVFNSDRYGFIDAIDFTFVDASFLTLFILLVSVALQYRSYYYVRATLILLICWQLTSLVGSYQSKTKSMFAVYAIKNKSAMALKNKAATFISPVDTADYNYHLKPHLISFNHPELHAKADFNLVKTARETILILNTPGYFPNVDPAKITVLVVCANFKLRAQALSDFKTLKTLVVDASNTSYAVKQAEAQCAAEGVAFHDVRRKGAYLLEL